MNNYCRNCGAKLEPNSKICPKCNAEVFEERIDVTKKEEELHEYQKKENKYIIIVLVLFVLAYIISSFGRIYDFASFVAHLIWLIAIVILIYARITMNKSRKIKIMFNIFMALVIIYLLYIVLLFIACSSIVNKGC